MEEEEVPTVEGEGRSVEESPTEGAADVLTVEEVEAASENGIAREDRYLSKKAKNWM